MANFEARTASSGLKIDKKDIEKVKQYIDRFCFGGDIECSIDKAGTLHFYGYEWPYVTKKELKDEDGDPIDICEQDDCCHEFFMGLRKFVKPSHTYTVQMIGAENCRFPMSACEARITNKRVTYSNFKC